MLITLNKIKESELKIIIEENKSIFEQDENGDAEFNIIAMYIIYEKIKGENSFFKAYFDTISRSYTMYDWNNAEVNKTECEDLIF